MYEDALATYNYAAEFDANNPEVHINRAKALYELDRYTEALEACQKAIAFDSRSAENYSIQGNILGKMNRYEEALVIFCP